MRKTRKDKGRKRAKYKKRVVSMQTKTSPTIEKYGRRGAYSIGTYSDRSPQEDRYRARQLELDDSRIKRQRTADAINIAREGRGWIKTASDAASYFV